MRISRWGVVVAFAGVVLVAATACDLPPADDAGTHVQGAHDDDWPQLDTRTEVEVAPPSSDVSTITEQEWTERFERSQRAKHARAVGLRDAADRCYEKLRDPKSGGSKKLAQAICFGGRSPAPRPSAAAPR